MKYSNYLISSAEVLVAWLASVSSSLGVGCSNAVV